MTAARLRTAAERRADTLALLRTPAIDVWVASAGAGADGVPSAHLVPLSLAWLDDRVVISLEAGSRTARNLESTGRARLALGTTRDVVMIDAVLDGGYDVPAAPAGLADGYAGQADWDPRGSTGSFRYLLLRPDRIQAWREERELSGRMIMKDGRWLD
jgi:hypothetical protein